MIFIYEVVIVIMIDMKEIVEEIFSIQKLIFIVKLLNGYYWFMRISDQTEETT